MFIEIFGFTLSNTYKSIRIYRVINGQVICFTDKPNKPPTTNKNIEITIVIHGLNHNQKDFKDFGRIKKAKPKPNKNKIIIFIEG